MKTYFIYDPETGTFYTSSAATSAPNLLSIEVDQSLVPKIFSGELVFNPKTKKFVKNAEAIERKSIEENNRRHVQFLSSTDWKVMRHIREKALGQTTSMTEAEYLELEQLRSDAASKIERL